MRGAQRRGWWPPWRVCLTAAAVILATGFAGAAEPAGTIGPQARGRQHEAPVSDGRPDVFRGEDHLVRVYELILDAAFPQADAALRRACGPAPPEACHVLEATALWWRIQLDPESRRLDEAFTTAVDRAVRTTEAWAERSPDDDEAWFYVGAAYAARVQWLVLRTEKLAAARDGKRIKEALEHSLVLNPTLYDAYFGVGMYRYYADVAPAAARFLRFLLLLPGGDRKDGLAQMLRAREQGRLLQGEADYQLHIIYLWYERQTGRAIELLEDLRAKYPGNPLFPMQIADILDVYEHDITGSLHTWRELLSDALAGRIHAATIAEVRARLGIAAHLNTLALTDGAIDELEQVIEARPSIPHGSLALAYLRLGEAHDRMNARSDAVTAYRLAIETAPDDDRHNIRRDATSGLRKAPNAAHAEAFRLSLEGLRRLEGNDVAAAASSLERSIALNARDPIAHYRYARVLMEQHEPALAIEQLNLAIRDARTCPAPILGQVYVDLAQLYERSGQIDRAMSAYRVASTLFGASNETHRQASRALARLLK